MAIRFVTHKYIHLISNVLAAVTLPKGASPLQPWHTFLSLPQKSMQKKSTRQLGCQKNASPLVLSPNPAFLTTHPHFGNRVNKRIPM